MALLKNTTISGINSIQLPAGSTSERTNGTKTVTSFGASTTWTCPAGVTSIEILVVAGGGGGGSDMGGGGGAGGVVYDNGYPVTPGTVYTVTVGNGGAGAVGYANSPPAGTNGQNSQFDTIIAIGGGGGGSGHYYPSPYPGTQGRNGGSGGGNSPLWGRNTWPVGQGRPGQGNNGGAAGRNADGDYTAGGGGGAGAPGATGFGNVMAGGGGNGLPFSITGTTYYYAGGGGGGTHQNIGGNGGRGGGGGGGNWSGGSVGNGGTGGTTTGGAGTFSTTLNTVNGGAGATNTGSGGGGGGHQCAGGAGGSGVIVISYSPATDLGLFRYNSDGEIAEVLGSTGWKSLNPGANWGSSNALYYTNDLSNGSWTKENITLTAGQTAPDGSATAYTITENSVSGDHRLYQLPSLGAGYPGLYVAKIFVKYTGSCQYFLVRHAGISGQQYCYFDLLNRKVTETVGQCIGEIIPAENGWLELRVTVFYNLNGGGAYGDTVFAMSTVGTGGGSNPTYAGNGTRNLQIWKPELCTATDINANGYRTHIYRNVGGTQAFTPDFTGNVEVLVVGGGGSGASTYGGIGNGPRGGGGAGGVIHMQEFHVTAGKRYAITVGAGGAQVSGNNVNGNQGGNSRFDNVVALGGGYGGYYNSGNPTAGTGGSGGGNAYNAAMTGGQPGAGNRGNGCADGGGGGGGAGGGGIRGQEGNGHPGGGAGGPGLLCEISGAPTYYGGGGGAGGYPQSINNYGLGGIGGGGRGGQGYDQSSSIAGPQGGYDGYGGGGGAGGSGAEGGKGGHGTVIVRYRAPTKCAIFYQSGTWTAPANVTSAKVLVVAGGGGGGMDMAGGGGAGGVLYNAQLHIQAGKTYAITVGDGGKGARARNIVSERGNNGANSSFGGPNVSIVAIGGGGGASLHDASTLPAGSGGSGGGASCGRLPSGGASGTGGYGGGIRGTGTPGQGHDGGDSIGQWYPTGGGGAGGPGLCNPGKGGDGLPFNLCGTMLYFGGGGGGSGYSAIGGNGGFGGGGAGAILTPVYGGGWSLNWGQFGHGGRTGWQVGYTGGHAGANTGGGGGGGSHYNNSNAGGDGGSGVVIINWE